MKMFKRLAAVLLAGAMVLAMLTACGGPKTDEQKAEDAYMAALNGLFNAEWSNNAEIKAAAKKLVSENVTDEGEFTENGFMSVDTDRGLILMILPDGNKPAALTSEDIASLNEESINAMIPDMQAQLKAMMKDQNGNSVSDEQFAASLAGLKEAVIAAGVGVVKKADGKYYAAMGVQLPMSSSGDSTQKSGQ